MQAPEDRYIKIGEINTRYQTIAQRICKGPGFLSS